MCGSHFLESLASIFTILGVIAGIVGFIVTYQEYKRNQLIKRAEFYTKLFETLFKDPTYTEIREELDSYEYSEEYYGELEKKLKARGGKLFAQMTNYLNFLEYVMVLEKNKVITHADVIDLLDYYLTTLAKNRVAKKYIEELGFENLLKAINEVERKKS